MESLSTSLHNKSIFNWKSWGDPNNITEWMIKRISELERRINRTPSRRDFKQYKEEVRVKQNINTIEAYADKSYERILDEYVNRLWLRGPISYDEFRKNGYAYYTDPEFKADIKVARLKLREYGDFDVDADGHLYLLQCLRKSDHEVYWYVGQTVDIEKRIKKHINKGGDFAKEKESDMGCNILVSSDNIRYLIEIDKIKDVYKLEDETDTHFRKRLKRMEWNRSRKAVKKLKSERILGGK